MIRSYDHTVDYYYTTTDTYNFGTVQKMKKIKPLRKARSEILDTVIRVSVICNCNDFVYLHARFKPLLSRLLSVILGVVSRDATAP